MYLLTQFGIVRVCVLVKRIWDRVSVGKWGQSVESCEFACVWTEFGIV